ncbi:dirigent protein 22-like [Abrus precatorius]|uniref:Dirigent protein n=1 Tax=Abrus precatorius TaxID=3816 RepID=A0A8B8L861_ABRPR|nr:dirigent protein 22-like [Abrus precatorius]
MANSKTILFTFLLLLFHTFLFSLLATASYYQNISPAYLGFREEKLTHIHFYFHEIVSSPNPSLVFALEPLKGKSKSPLPFGSLAMIEDPLTVGPKLDSKMVGKAQGFYISAAHQEGTDLELVMGMTFAFTDGEYNGSTLSVLGRNPISSAVREMPIVGGTGSFRFARGFTQARTIHVEHSTGDAVVEYNVFVFHYSSLSLQGFNDGVEFMTDPVLNRIQNF